jgi:hypothetical protein
MREREWHVAAKECGIAAETIAQHSASVSAANEVANTATTNEASL